MVYQAMTKTTIKLDRDTKSRLDKLKIHKKDSYDDVIQKILSLLNTLKDNPFQARLRLSEIDQARKKIKRVS
jgi:hypothetical protein